MTEIRCRTPPCRTLLAVATVPPGATGSVDVPVCPRHAKRHLGRWRLRPFSAGPDWLTVKVRFVLAVPVDVVELRRAGRVHYI